MFVKVYIVQIQRQLFLRAVFVSSGTAECAQTLWTRQWNTGGCYMWRIVSYL